MGHLTSLRTGLLAACLALLAQTVHAQCISLNVYDPDGYAKGKSISLGLFELEGGRVIYNGRLETPRQVLLESLKEDLQKSRLFSTVTVAASDVAVDTDYLLKGEIRGISGGSQLMRIFVGGTGSAGQMRVAGRLLGPGPTATAGEEARPLIADWECNSFDMGGAFGLGNNEKAARENADKISNSLTKNVFGKMEKRIKQVEAIGGKDSEKQAVRGETEPSSRKWREKAKLDADDYGDEIESFVIKSDRERARGVDALWLTAASYQAHQRLLPMLAQTAILKGGDIRRGMLTEIEPLAPLAGQDVYVLAATFNVSSSEAPFVWRTEDIRRSTFLTRAGAPDLKIAPVEFLDRKIPPYVVYREQKVFKRFSTFWAFHPILLAFPTKNADGSPWLNKLDDAVELHTVVDGRQFVLKFNLKDFDLRSLDDLRMTQVKAGT